MNQTSTSSDADNKPCACGIHGCTNGNRKPQCLLPAPAPADVVADSIDTPEFRLILSMYNQADITTDALVAFIDSYIRTRLAALGATASKQAILQELVDIAQECDMGYGATAETVKDTERLDYMEKNLLREGSMRFPDGSFKTVNAWSIASDGTNLRAALDAAKAVPQPPKE